MFYVYDLDGIRFRGPMEALERQKKVERRESVKELHSGERAEPFPEPEGQQSFNSAVEAYRKATRRENMVEPLVHIHQIMTSPVDTITGDVALLSAWRRLHDRNISQMVVVSDQQDVVGMLSDRDILRRINVIDEDVVVEQGLMVKDVMQTEVITTDHMSDIRRVARVMAFYHISAMPVIGAEDRLTGIVTRGDILRGFAENPKLNLWA